MFDNIFVLEPYDQNFSAKVEFQIPFQEFNDKQDNVDILQFEPRNGVYLKLQKSLDTNARVLKFQSNTGGVFAFVEKPSSVSL